MNVINWTWIEIRKT